MNNKAAIDFISETFTIPLVGAEGGVGSGKHAMEMLKTLNIKTLYLIDIWADYTDQNVKFSRYSGEHVNVCRKFALYAKKVKIWKENSIQAAKKIPDNSLHFVYIDANHEYAFVKQDIECWYPKVIPGGIISGHDYSTLRETGFGVVKAVQEFTQKHKYSFGLCERGPKNWDWHIQKQENNCV